MDYEKKYKEALERAKDFMNGEVHYALRKGENIMCWIFPELRESEDERIRKYLLKLAERCPDDSIDFMLDVKKEDVIAWLEKQGEQKSAWSEEDESILQGIWDEILANKHDAKEYEYKTYDKFLNWLKSLKDRMKGE